MKQHFTVVCSIFIAMTSVSCASNVRSTPSAVPVLLQSNILSYPLRGISALDGLERDVVVTGLPSSARLGALLSAAEGQRLDWTIHCKVAADDRLQNCRLVEIFPDTAQTRASVSPVVSALRITPPAARSGQQAEDFTIGIRVTTRLDRVTMDEPCAAIFFCPLIETARPGEAPPRQP